MLIDLTIEVTESVIKDAEGNEKMASLGHLGTHFDVMNKEFPLDYTIRRGVVFPVCGKTEIGLSDIDPSLVEENLFVAFRTGFIEREPYGSKAYFTLHPELTEELIGFLISRKVSIIGIDCAGIRRGKQHTPADQRCADAGVFVVENLCLKDLPNPAGCLTVFTFPVRFGNSTGLPCRVVAQTEK